MEELRVRKQWLCDKEGNIAYKPLHEWFDYFGIKEGNGKCSWMQNKKTGRLFIDIELANGNGMTHSQYEELKNKLFFVGNADLDRPKLREKYY